MSAKNFTITTGYTFSVPVTLKKNGVTFNIPVAAIVKAAVIRADRTAKLLDAVTLSSAAVGSDWANSLVIVEFSEVQTAQLTKPEAVKIEIQVDDAGKLPWFVSGEVVKGNI